jgi:hypothetical protein
VTSTPGEKKASGKGTSITVKGLQNGTAYTFTVTATNKVGTGLASSPSSPPVTPATELGAPTGVTAAVTASNPEASVSFNLPASDGGSTITGYTVTSKPGGITGTGTGSPIPVTGLTYGTAYTFTVTATNEIGTGKASSPSKSVTPYTVPGEPLDVKAKAGNAEATVSFNAPASNGSPITSYTVTPYIGTTAQTTATGSKIL